MEYNFFKREIYMPKKHFRKDRHIKLGKTQNMFFATLWFSKNGKASHKELFTRVYGYKNIDKHLLINLARILREKRY